ncbi:hypothetical protein EV421DRAFT_1866911 [Armillaria borealis]|uniref:Uncharacterized protein n=1 Tax=Armillaria borealis TaxID=47425 RepID=A0AA39M658_9AGAR|nr:hypothetical protein EV421DRAFT_1866911 [Armillaria borealis]
MTLEIVAQMQHRVSTKPLDKVAGLVYLLRTHSIPIYDAEQSEVDAWEVLMEAMVPWNRAELFFYYPEPGSGKKRWRPLSFLICILGRERLVRRRIQTPTGTKVTVFSQQMCGV